VQKQLEELAGLTESGSVTPTGTNPGDLPIIGAIQGKYAERITASLAELLTSSAHETLEVYAVNESLPEDGYYTPDSATTGRLTTQYGNLDEFDASLVKKGTRASHRRAVGTDPRERPHPFGNDSTGYVGVPAAAAKVQWLDYERQTTQAATPDQTVAAEFGDVKLYDVETAPSGFDTRPFLVYDLPLANAGDVDAAVFDTYGNNRTDGEGDFAWGQVFRTDHEFRGDAVLSNGRLRITLDEGANTTSAERWDDTNSQWADVSLGSSDWHLFDIDLTHPGAAQVRARLTYSDGPELFELAAVLHRGWEDLQLYSPPDTQVPSGLQTRLDPIASSQVVDLNSERTLISRGVLRANG